MPRLLPTIQHAMLRTNRGPMRRLWRLVYGGAAHAYAAYVMRGEAGASAYVRSTLANGEVLPGLTDIDVEIVLPSSTDLDAARRRVRRRFRRVRKALPVLGDLLFDWPSVLDDDGLAQAATETTFTYGLDRGPARSVWYGPHVDVDRTRLLERPELYGPARSWRRLRGPSRSLPDAPRDVDSRRLSAWLEVQNWWRWAFQICTLPDRPRNAYTCVKLIAEPLRAWFWLVEGRRVERRVEALELGLVHLPKHAEAFERALELHRALPTMPAAPLAEFLPPFLDLSAGIADELASQLEPAGVTEVRLSDVTAGVLALPHGTWSDGPPLLPLIDWRSLAAPVEPDETFAIVPGEPDPATIAALATAAEVGPYPTLRARGLLLRPARMGGRQRLRTVQCPPTDPVSFALLEGAPVARFPNARGWSIQDTVRRALAEHAAWLGEDEHRPGMDAGNELGLLITAARAGLVWETLEAGDPQLPLTADATLEQLGATAAGARSAAEAARESYQRYASKVGAPREPVIAALRQVVERLPAYATDRVPAELAS